MKLELTVSEIAGIYKQIQQRPAQLFEMIRLDIKEVVGNYLTAMMNAELTHYLGRESLMFGWESKQIIAMAPMAAH